MVLRLVQTHSTRDSTEYPLAHNLQQCGEIVKWIVYNFRQNEWILVIHRRHWSIKTHHCLVLDYSPALVKFLWCPPQVPSILSLPMPLPRTCRPSGSPPLTALIAVCIFTFFSQTSIIDTFNLDPLSALVQRGPPNTNFGFSVSLHKDRNVSWWVKFCYKSDIEK